MPFKKNRSHVVASLQLLTLIAVSVSTSAWAQSTQVSDSRQWRQANTEVGRHLRGHIDLLKAERGRLNTDPNISVGAFKEYSVAPELSEDAARKAVLVLHADVVADQAIGEMERYRRDAQILEILQNTQKLWIQAVAAKEQLLIQQRIAEAASISLELARRMEKVGNWGRNRLVDIEIGYQTARNQLLVADQAAFNSRQKLATQIGTHAWKLPNALAQPISQQHLPELQTPLDDQFKQLLARHPQYLLLEKEAQYYERIVGPVVLEEWRAHLSSILEQSASWTQRIPTVDRTKIIWSHNLEKAIQTRASALRLSIQTKSDLQQAREHLRAAETQASDIMNRLQKLYLSAEEEALMRYNGMFISTWELISKAQAKMQAELSTAQAKQVYWLALADIRSLLAGASYAGPGGSAASAANSPTGKGH